MELIVDPEFSALIPPLKPEERTGLESSLKVEGCRDALVVWAGHDILLDGHNRYEICRRELIPFNITQLAFDSREAAGIWICDNQRARRNLEPYAIIQLEERRAEYLKRKAEANELRGRGVDGSGGRGNKKNPLQISEKGFTPINVVKTIAERSGFSTDTVAKARVIEARADAETKARLLRGQITINDAHRRIVEPERRAERMASLIEPARLEGRFPVILGDPPWRYEFLMSEMRDIENHYPTMALDDICALPVGEWSLTDCTLFLWATSPKVGEAFEVLRAWGFIYRSSAVWDKEIIGSGYYFRQQHEWLLVATKGNPPTPAQSDRVSSVIRSRRTSTHSQKPELVYEIIEAMYPQFHEAELLLELFQRKPRKGWKGWGNQLPHETETEPCELAE